MENGRVLIIKTVHSLLFLLMVFSLGYALYAAIAGRYDWYTVAALLIILADGLSIVLNQGRCPLTTLAEHYGAREGAVTHLFVGRWAGRYVFKFFIAVYIVELVWLGIGFFS